MKKSVGLLSPSKQIRWSLSRIYYSNEGWAKGRSQRDELEIKFGRRGTLKLGPSNFGNCCFRWRGGKAIPLVKLADLLDEKFPKVK